MFSRKHPLPIPPGTLHLCYVVPANERSETLSTSKRRSRGMCSFKSLGLLWHFLGKLSENVLVFLLRRRCQAFHGPEKAAGASPRFRFSRLFVSSLETLNHYCKSSHIILQTISFENRMEPHVEPVSFGCQSSLRSERCQFPGNIVRPALNQYLARTYFRNLPWCSKTCKTAKNIAEPAGEQHSVRLNTIRALHIFRSDLALMLTRTY